MARLGGTVFIPDEAGNPIPSNSANLAIYDEDRIAALHRQKGFRAAYAPCVPMDDTARIRRVTKAFADQDVTLAEVGFWENILDQDPSARKRARTQAMERFAAADEMGVRCFITTTGAQVYGSVNDNVTEDENIPDADLQAAADFANEVLIAVKPRRCVFTYEMFPLTALDSVSQMEKLLKAVDRPGFGVHLDLTNLYSSARAFFYRRQILNQCVQSFGDRIVSCHVKDMVLRPGLSVMLEERMIGRGHVDIGAYIRAMHEINPNMPVMLEHMNTQSEYDEAAQAIQEIAQKVAVPF